MLRKYPKQAIGITIQICNLTSCGDNFLSTLTSFKKTRKNTKIISTIYELLFLDTSPSAAPSPKD